MMKNVAALALIMGTLPVLAQTVVLDSGQIHLRGSLVNGACAVASESEDLRVQMGQYRTNAFSGVGSFAPTSAAFTLRLVDCASDVSRYVGVLFSGDTPQEDPLVFVARGTGGEGAKGVGVALFDQQQRQIIPNTLPTSWVAISAEEMTFHFTARYRAIAENITPGHLYSDVWFTLVYP
ncbi:type 1 fimbrial protein subunit FimI [Kosakonia oryzae]|uniref:type 1 fimbrial protein subunit FimI n=1 Tax=Kosakonia oryzae TaxID=497725 RepID=UPI001D05D4A2|nr:type 1 fimbrial protein subunit FimI [Kosakonia oryzae]UDJ81216.1 type 1 fimbrial protein subunit FimI [Kosakonia oryzae]